MRLTSAMAAETILRIKQYGSHYSSDHEAWGLALEEFVEAGRDLKEVVQALDEFFMLCMLKFEDRSNSAVQEVLDRCETKAIHAAAELIQLAVVCEKAKNRDSHTF